MGLTFEMPLKGQVMVPREEDTVPTARARMHGGTIINVITGLIFFGLIGFGVYWVIKTTGQAGEQYMTGMVNTQKKATTISCQMNLRSIGQTLQTYAISNEAYPDSQQALVDFAGYGSKLFHCPDPNGGEYIYIPGHRADASAPSVLVYESKPVHNGKCNVLFSDGQIASLTPEELQQAMGGTPTRRRP
jgi:prepilin-type processing-associated H-X9-DG protein